MIRDLEYKDFMQIATKFRVVKPSKEEFGGRKCLNLYNIKCCYVGWMDGILSVDHIYMAACML